VDFALRQYSIPVLFAVLLHVAALGVLQIAWEPARTAIREIKPRIIQASLLVIEPKQRQQISAPAPPPVEAAPVIEKPVPEAPAAVTEKPAPELDPQPDRRAQERERELAAREKRLRELADASFLTALDSESSELAESAQAEDDVAAASFRLGIYKKIVANWSRPPSARNGMEALLLVELVPIGDIVAVTLIKGSGSRVFDQSAESAVRKARRFDVPGESALFEKHFRRFTLLFRPEDLLR
jgi:colicin import membrane protein